MVFVNNLENLEQKGDQVVTGPGVGGGFGMAMTGTGTRLMVP